MPVRKFKVERSHQFQKKRKPSRSPSIVDGKVIPSNEQPPIIRELQEGSNTVLLAFSGKDSLATWLFLRDHGFDVIPYWMYVVPDLSYDVEMLEYYEHYFKTHIIRYPHSLLANTLANYVYQPPHRVAIIDALGFARYEYSYKEVEAEIVESLNLHPNTYTAQGIRAADNQSRARMLQQNGSIGVVRRYWWAIWDWKLDDVLGRIKKEGLLLHRLYGHTGATGDIWSYSFLKTVKRDFPDDWAKIVEIYPLIDIEFFRYEKVK